MKKSLLKIFLSILFFANITSNAQTWAWAKGAHSVTGGGFGEGYSSCVDTSGNVYITGLFNGSTITFGSYVLTTNLGADAYLVKYDSNGNVLWAKSAGGTDDDGSISVNCDISGNVYITGFFRSATIVFDTYTLTNNVTSSIFVAKYDPNGNVLWAKSSVGTNEDDGYSVSSYTGGVYVTGVFSSPSLTLGTSVITNTNNNFAAFLVKYDPNGNVLFVQAFRSGGDDWFAVSADKNCNAYITGDFMGNTLIIGTSTLALTGSETPFTAKLSFSADCNSPNGVTQFSNSNSQISIFPNPNSGSFKIKIDNEIENGELVLLNSLGETVHEQKIIRGENNIITNKISSGLYHYIILQNKQQVGNGKLIIE